MNTDNFLKLNTTMASLPVEAHLVNRGFWENRMKSKSALLVVTLVLFTAATSTAFAAVEQPDAKTGQAEAVKAKKSEPEKPVKSVRNVEEKTDTSAPFSLEDLFGCKPMGEDGHHMPLPEAASGVKQQETMQPMQ